MTPSLHLRIGGASMWAVPSVHFRLAFAEEVNRLCSRERPEAIAVELGPQTAAAARAWLQELGVGGGRSALPCMLGLIKQNRMIRPAHREAAARLQRITGKELHELPPELLQQFLDYSSISSLYLSPTDSIIEAARCALELKVPLYGVDLEETAARQQKAIMVQDPMSASRGMEQYVDRVGGYAEHQRDEEIDSRREFAMAARLNYLSEKHRRIVFVCGLAHWRQLRTLLLEDKVRPSPVAEAAGEPGGQFRRVIVHPLLAIHHLDTFPAFAGAYENDRPNVASPPVLRLPVDARRLFVEILQMTYERHFYREEADEQLDRVLEDWESKAVFEEFLQNLCLIHQRQTPDLFFALAAAQGMMSKQFCRAFGEGLMDFRWAGRADFPDLPILAPATSVAARPLKAELIDPGGHRSKAFYAHSVPEPSGVSVPVPIPWEWQTEPPGGEVERCSGARSNWVPIDTLMDALSFRAVRMAREQTPQTRSEVFEGSLQDGVDLKATLRSAAREEDRIYVRSAKRQSTARGAAEEDIDGFPIVWILRVADAADIHWSFSRDALATLRTFRGRAAEWDELGLPDAGVMVSSVIAVTGTHTDAQLSRNNYDVTRETRVGQVNFQPQCCVRRTSEWAEETRLARNPVLPASGFDELKQYYGKQFSWEAGEHPWEVTLVRLAIPFAGRAITVIAPDGYAIPSIVHREAASRGVEVRVVPLSYFPSEALRRISQIVWLPTVERTKGEVDLPIYPEHVMRHFDEPVDKFHRLIPHIWR